MAYSRFFMPLLHAAKGYDFGGKPPTGRAVLEMRDNTCKLSVMVQQLLPYTRCRVVLVFANAAKYVGLEMGSITTDSRGKAEERIATENIHTFDICTAVGVAIMHNETHVLCGFTGAEVSWQNSLAMWQAETAEEIAEGPQPEEIAIGEPTIGEPQIEDIPTPPMATRPQFVPVCAATMQLVSAVFSTSTPCAPFAKADAGIAWVQCDRLEQMPLPSEYQHHKSEPFVQESWANHEHFLLGMHENGTQYTIGIAGIYSSQDKATARRLGFSRFKSLDKDRNRTGDKGYWLMTVGM